MICTEWQTEFLNRAAAAVLADGADQIAASQSKKGEIVVKEIKERLAFMMEGIQAQEGFNWVEYEQLCRDALARIQVLEDQETVVSVLTRIATALEKQPL